MPTITKSIGTTGRDYSTITAWEADLDNVGIYASGDAAVGECYNDSVFDETVTINGGGTVGLTTVTLTVASGQRHDGTAGTGARIIRTAAATPITVDRGDTNPTTVSWLEITRSVAGGGATSTASGVISVDRGSPAVTCRNLIVHNLAAGRSPHGISDGVAGLDVVVLNCIVYRISATGAEARSDIVAGIHARQATLYNNTIHDISSNQTGSPPVHGIRITNNNSSSLIKNCVATTIATAGTGTAAGFSLQASNVADHNASEDATASGTGSLTSITVANQYVSTTVGSEDLHLKSGADLIDAGTDLGTTPTGVNIDIDGRDRDAEGDTWDIGADEFVGAAASVASQYYYQTLLQGAGR